LSREIVLKLAEALAERSDCQNRIAEVNKRLARSARVQEGEQPPEDPVTLLAELDRFYVRLLELVQAINRTNARTQLDGRFNISGNSGTDGTFTSTMRTGERFRKNNLRRSPIRCCQETPAYARYLAFLRVEAMAGNCSPRPRRELILLFTGLVFDPGCEVFQNIAPCCGDYLPCIARGVHPDEELEAR